MPLVYNLAILGFIKLKRFGKAEGLIELKSLLIGFLIYIEELLFIKSASFESINDQETVRGIIAEGCDAARDIARETLDDVREAMGLAYS